MSHFEVGKKVICIKDHSQGAVKKGQVFELLAMSRAKCKCTLRLDVGISIPSNMKQLSRCYECNWREPNHGVWWLDACIFAPYDTTTSEHTIESLLEQIDSPAILN